MPSNRRNPNVSIRESDLTGLVEGTPSGVPAGVVGTATLGPAFVPITVGDFDNDFVRRFGNTNGQYGPLAALEWLENSNSLTYVRVLGVGEGGAKLSNGNVAGAGFVAGDLSYDTATGQFGNNPYAYEDGAGEQLPGRTWFLGAYHKDAAGSTYLSDAGIDTSLGAKPVLRAVLITPRGVVPSLKVIETQTAQFGDAPLEGAPAGDTSANFGNGVSDLGGSLVGTMVRNSNNKSSFRLFLNGHINTSSSPNLYEASFDPRATNYFAKVLNRDPSLTAVKGHCLYAWWDIQPYVAYPTGSGVFSETSVMDAEGAVVISLGVFLLRGNTNHNEFIEDRPNYDNFEERYADALSPWVVSESGGNPSKRLFRLHSIDSGDVSNRIYKVGIENITKAQDQWTRFDVVLRRFNDNDENPSILESYSGVTLNPDDERYIMRVIGNRITKYEWDTDIDNQGLTVEGEYPLVSRYVFVEVSDDVESGSISMDTCPMGYEGMPHLVLNGFDASANEGLLYFDEDLLGSETPFRTLHSQSLTTLSTVQEIDTTFSGELSTLNDDLVFKIQDSTGEILIYRYSTSWSAAATALSTDLGADYDVTYSSTSDLFTIENTAGDQFTVTVSVVEDLDTNEAAQELLGSIKQPPFPTRETIASGVGQRRVANPNLWWGTQWNVTTSVQDPNGRVQVLDQSLVNYTKWFNDFGDIPMWAREGGVEPRVLSTAVGSVDVVLDTNSYNYNGFSLEKIAVIEDGSGRPDDKEWVNARYIRSGSTTELLSGERFITANDLERVQTRRFLKFTFPVFGGFDGVNLTDLNQSRLTDQAIAIEVEDTLRFPTPESRPTFQAWRRGAEILGNVDDVRIQLLLTPGIRQQQLTNEIIEMVETRFDSVYIMDLELVDDEGNNTYDYKSVSISQTIDKWNSRLVDSSFVATYYPDVIMRDVTSGEVVVAPSSVAVLGAFSLNDSVSFPWFAPAGFTRGALERVIRPATLLSEGDLGDLYQSSINPIVTFEAANSGPVVWGNKTTLRSESVLNRVNVRRLLLNIRRRVRDVSRDFLFEPNIDQTLARFQSLVTPIILDVRSNRGIRNGVVIIDSSTTTPLDVQNGIIRGIIAVQPQKSAEFATIDFEIRNPDTI